MPRGSFAVRRLTEYHDQSRDNFDRDVVGTLTDLINISGERNFTPERLRYYKDGNRVFLQYGPDANYSETFAGHLLSPDSGQTLTMESAERAVYPVGIDLWPSMSRRVNQAPQAGDVVGGGYGTIDLGNFDPETVSYTGTTADGYFWYHTAETGLDQALLAGVRGGTVFDHRVVDLEVAADVFTILEQRLNWYDVGPSVYRQSYTDLETDAERPQMNRTVGAVAADSGKAARVGSHRMTMAVHQAAGNSGLTAEVGSMGVKASAEPQDQFKSKGHSMDLEYTNPTGTYQICGAIRADPDRPTTKLRVPDFEIIKTPGSNIVRTRVLLMAVGSGETDAPASGSWSTPVEQNPVNSVVQEVEDNTIVGPVLDDAGTDSTGPATANAMDNPGGYQLGRDSITPDKKDTRATSQVGNRSIYDPDVCLILVDSEASGTVEIDVTTEQNS